jgi:hypothetical protein
MGTFLRIISVMMVFSAQLAERFGRKNMPMLKMNKTGIFHKHKVTLYEREEVCPCS